MQVDDVPLDRHQQHVVDSFLAAPNGTLTLVQACAGSGKTQTVIAAVRRVLEENPLATVLFTAFAKTTISNFKKDMGLPQDDDVLPQYTVGGMHQPGLLVANLHKVCSN
jgi:hypothetical protein